MTDGLLLIASRLRALDDGALAQLVRDRVSDVSRIRDLFDLADTLLTKDAVSRALEQLDRAALAVLAVACEEGAAEERVSLESLRDALARRSGEEPLDPGALREAADRAAETLLADADDDGLSTHPEVARVLTAWAENPSLSADALARLAPPAALAAVPRVDPDEVERRAGESAFQTVVAVAGLIDELAREPARELSRGGMSLPDARRLAAALARDLDDVPVILSLADRAGLVIRAGRTWSVTEAGSTWSGLPTAGRWRILAEAWLDALAPATRSILAERTHAEWGPGLVDHVLWRFPGGAAWIADRISVFTRDAGLLGITTGDVPSTAGRSLLTVGPERAADVMAEHLPAEVDRVYLQHDLTVVSPGPLDPVVESRLLTVADVEGRGLAASYRISAASVTRALAAGDTRDGIRDFLESVSLTGIPQPLDYLLDEVSARFGRLVVRPVDGRAADPGAHTVISSPDAGLLDYLVVDRDLAPLRLARLDESTLVSSASPGEVERALTAARLAPVREDADGERLTGPPLGSAPSRPGVSLAAPGPTPDAAEALLARIRATDTSDDGAAWTSRQLDVAIRAKVALTVRVRMPDGREVDHLLEPTSMAGGRLRALDRIADIERTLPVSSIVALFPGTVPR